MRGNIIKLVIIGILIVLCIEQTTQLWLGNMPSHNFLGIKASVHNTILEPKAIWVNMVRNKLTYNMDEGKNESDSDILIDELLNQVKNDKIKLLKVTNMTFEDLYAMQGIIYEYGTLLSFNEMMGGNLIKNSENLKFNNLFVDLSGYNEHKTYLYLIGEKANEIYKITLNERLENHQKVIETFSSNNTNITNIGYQPSVTSNQRQYIKGNVFLPTPTQLSSRSSAIIYDRIIISNPFSEKDPKEVEDELESYVNSFFSNPRLKEVEKTTGGSIIFRENTRTSVRYSPVGTLEFNATYSNEADSLTPAEKLVKVNDFIEACEGIPYYLKRGLYLSGIQSDAIKGEYTYYFDYKYEGFPVMLSEAVKKELDLKSMLELVIKNNQIVRGKWSMLELEIDHERLLDKGELTEDCNTIVSQFYSKQMLSEEESDILQSLQCSYRIEGLQEPIRFGWTIIYKNQIYYL